MLTTLLYARLKPIVLSVEPHFNVSLKTKDLFRSLSVGNPTGNQMSAGYDWINVCLAFLKWPLYNSPKYWKSFKSFKAYDLWQDRITLRTLRFQETFLTTGKPLKHRLLSSATLTNGIEKFGNKLYSPAHVTVWTITAAKRSIIFENCTSKFDFIRVTRIFPHSALAQMYQTGRFASDMQERRYFNSVNASYVQSLQSFLQRHSMYR